jgi:DNA repair exonuclease SbcCD nuclease subunit
MGVKIGITADVHLRSKEETPERYRALGNVLEQSRTEGAQQVIISGDLFDAEIQNYSEFEALAGEYEDLQIHVIPGNHDPGISERSIAGDNIHVYDEPQVAELGGVNFLFIPFAPGKTMMQAISESGIQPTAGPWVLIGHGDYYGGVREPNPLEPGTYMPLTRTDVESLGAQTVFLGHIHKPGTWGLTSYVGSPCGLDINETGSRRFLLYDTQNGMAEERTVTTDHIYFIESFVVVPVEDEEKDLVRQIDLRIEGWGLDKTDLAKVCVRISAAGYTTDKRVVQDALKKGFAPFKHYKDEDPCTTNLIATQDDQLNAIAQRTRQALTDLEWDFGGDEPDREQVLLAALATVYG